MLFSFVPASTTRWHEYCSRQSDVSVQLVTQTHPPSSSAQDELLGQFDVLPQELEHIPPGN